MSIKHMLVQSQIAPPTLLPSLQYDTLHCAGAVKDTGEVIRFTGQYKASRGQAAALVFYVFMGELSQLCRRAVCLHFAKVQHEADAACRQSRRPCLRSFQGRAFAAVHM